MKRNSAVESVMVRVSGNRVEYHVEIGHELLDRTGEFMRRAFGTPRRRIAIVSNKRVFGLYGARLHASLHAADYQACEIFVGDGERFKTLRSAERVLEQLARLGFERCDVVLALGGGMTGDLAGFVAAVHLRGLAFVNVPTTLLAQIDASVGGKTAVNTARGKNVIGVFHHPHLVVVDPATLTTLDRRDLTAGWCEAIKHGVAGDRTLFDDTLAYLRDRAATSRRRQLPDESFAPEPERIAELIHRHIKFKAAIISGDERESIERTDARSRRILNFGHTIGHALEAATAYRRFRHGEAIGRGMIAAGAISQELGLLDDDSFRLLLKTISLTGCIPEASDLDEEKIFSQLSSDKKVVDGSIQWVLIDRIGSARITDSHSIPPAVIRRAIRLALDHKFSRSLTKCL